MLMLHVSSRSYATSSTMPYASLLKVEQLQSLSVLKEGSYQSLLAPLIQREMLRQWPVCVFVIQGSASPPSFMSASSSVSIVFSIKMLIAVVARDLGCRLSSCLWSYMAEV